MSGNRTTELQGILDEFEYECYMLRVEASETRARDDVVLKAYERIRDEFAGRIAATLGGGTCEWVLEHSGTLYDKWRCSKCGYLFVEPRCDPNYTDMDPNYCPNCGARVEVVDE